MLEFSKNKFNKRYRKRERNGGGGPTKYSRLALNSHCNTDIPSNWDPSASGFQIARNIVLCYEPQCNKLFLKES